MLNLNKFRIKDTGQSLLEITIVLGVAAAIIVAISSITIQGLSDSTYAQNQLQATKFAQDGIEKIRSFRNNNTLACIGAQQYRWIGQTNSLFGNQMDVICGATCHFILEDNACGTKMLGQKPSASSWEKVDTDGVFSRRIEMEDYVESGVTRKNLKKVTVYVRWSDRSGDHESTLVTILSNY